MTGAPPASVNRDRLAKVLALMSSPVDGEALAATRMMVKLLADAGLRPERLVDGIPAERVAAPAEWAWTTPWDIRPTAPQPRAAAARPKETHSARPRPGCAAPRARQPARKRCRPKRMDGMGRAHLHQVPRRCSGQGAVRREPALVSPGRTRRASAATAKVC
jgi:hypothetical protein